jgi:hypothetical protein
MLPAIPSGMGECVSQKMDAEKRIQLIVLLIARATREAVGLTVCFFSEKNAPRRREGREDSAKKRRIVVGSPRPHSLLRF